MKFLRTLFLLQRLYVRQTWLQVFLSYAALACLFFACLVIAPPLESFAAGTKYLLIPVFLLLFYGTLRLTIRTLLVGRYLRRYLRAASQHWPGGIHGTSINAELDHVDYLTLIANYGNAQLFLATFNFYRLFRK